MRGKWAFTLWLAASLGCTDDDTFQCVSDDQCSPDGTCEANQYCSFPDSGCESGRRFGDQAATGIAGQCVPVEGASTGVTGSTGAPGTTTMVGSSTTVAGSTGSPDGSTTVADPASTGSDTSSGGAASTSTGDASSSSTGEVNPCASDPETCDVCFDCTTPPGTACFDATQACSADAGCIGVYECLRICVLDGICPDCCVDVDPETATLAAAMMDCQTVACMENPVCDAFSEFVCSTAGG